MSKSIAIIGGGAAGFFTAINLAELHPEFHITIFEKSNKFLSKVKVSGGGRCNVTHACFKAEELIEFYPRGKNYLLEAFKKFGPKETIEWFEKRGVRIKKESDGRMFPITNSSQTIIDCFLEEVKKHKIEIKLQHDLKNIEKQNQWNLEFANGEKTQADVLIITAGSSNGIWNNLKQLGHQIIEPVPSLFTFHITDNRIKDLSGLSVPTAIAKIKIGEYESHGPLLITHWGMSGPAILKLSAWEAIQLAENNYQAEAIVNFIGQNKKEIRKQLTTIREVEGKKLAGTYAQFNIPTRLWKSIMDELNLSDRKWAGLGNKELDLIAENFCEAKFQVTGKSTFKEEFVTCGGVNLDEVDLTRFESKLHPDLFFAGEILNVDAVTGGFNFQAAWTGGWMVARAVN